MQPHPDTTWILLADEGRARILKAPGHGVGEGTEVEEVEQMDDPAAHAHNADFRRDARGRNNAAGEHGGPGGASFASGHGSSSQPGSDAASAGEEKLDHEAERFARHVAQRLAEARRQHRYDHLRIAAAPKFLGRLRHAMHAEVREVVEEEVDKDLLQLDARAIAQRLQQGGLQATAGR